MRLPAEVDAVRATLEPLGTAVRAAGEKKYLKSDLDFLGAGCRPKVYAYRTHRQSSFKVGFLPYIRMPVR